MVRHDFLLDRRMEGSPAHKSATLGCREHDFMSGNASSLLEVLQDLQAPAAYLVGRYLSRGGHQTLIPQQVGLASPGPGRR